MNIREGLINKKVLGSSGGGSTDVQQLNVTSNGTYIAEDGTAYSPVVVNVPNPSSGEIEITENGAYDVTEKASAVVNVSGGGTEPTKGFMPTEWDANGGVVKGKLFGMDTIPNYFFYTWGVKEKPQYANLEDLDTDTPIKTIKGSAFVNTNIKKNIQRLIKNVENLGDSALSSTKISGAITLPTTLKNLGASVFNNCEELTSVTFTVKPDLLRYDSLAGCSALTTINVPWSVGEMARAPWGATNATINYNYEG